eukprot:Gregarina_sp_Poly_1__2825@NODE_1788_length_3328_cov_62_804048_g1165_i0_p2_GENE_NODE_1788_length_3328_cov_62_804048_g1165_i0NODE_1788_length_3328_cov_62_804048_g1165_i0_p2_ORF_typecomplete_len108_score10_54_NODE_1788_length_3328_cov_62_804048_g1165_i022042527
MCEDFFLYSWQIFADEELLEVAEPAQNSQIPIALAEKNCHLQTIALLWFTALLSLAFHQQRIWTYLFINIRSEAHSFLPFISIPSASNLDIPIHQHQIRGSQFSAFH